MDPAIEALKHKGKAFFDLHHTGAPFIMPNPWDIGSARMLAAKGFKAIATTSAGFAFASGIQEGTLDRDEVLAHCRQLAASVDIPLSADLEDGYGDDLNGVQDCYKLAAQTGLVGGSIEDARFASDDPIYDLAEATARVEAAVDAVRDLPFKFTLTARAENYFHGRQDLADTIGRLQAYQEAGADVLYAPGLTNLADVRSVVASVDLPVNFVVGLKDAQFAVAELADVGIARISIGSALNRAAFGAAMDAADEMMRHGTFEFARTAKPFADINELF